MDKFNPLQYINKIRLFTGLTKIVISVTKNVIMPMLIVHAIKLNKIDLFVTPCNQ